MVTKIDFCGDAEAKSFTARAWGVAFLVLNLGILIQQNLRPNRHPTHLDMFPKLLGCIPTRIDSGGPPKVVDLGQNCSWQSSNSSIPIVAERFRPQRHTKKRIPTPRHVSRVSWITKSAAKVRYDNLSCELW
jgi:hypothetical protein